MSRLYKAVMALTRGFGARVVVMMCAVMALVVIAFGLSGSPAQAQAQAQGRAQAQGQPSWQTPMPQTPTPRGAPINLRPPVQPQVQAQVQAAGPTNAPTPVATSLDQSAAQLDYVLAPNDRVKMMIFGEPDLSGEFVIDSAGTASLPLIGEVRAAGMNLRTFQRDVERRLKAGYLVDPRVSAQIMNFRPIFVLGEVRTPGEHQFASGLTLLNAIAQAGGFTPLANSTAVYIRREGGSTEERVTVRNGVPILPGDTLRVEKSAMFIFGEVRTQGELPIPPGLTMRTAVAQAGGFTELADTQTIFVKRGGVGEEVKIALDSAELVQSGDILRVDKSSFFIMGEVGRTGEFPMRPGLSIVNAAILAGGFSTRADTRRVFIRRVGELKEKRYKLTNDLIVQKGDTIRIPERFF
jgi:protein involved in polysaccharide export with SLBB domain